MLQQVHAIALAAVFTTAAGAEVVINDFDGTKPGWPNHDFSYSFSGASMTDGGASGTFGTYTDSDTSGGWTAEYAAGIDLTSVAEGIMTLNGRLGVGHTAQTISVQLEDTDGTRLTYFFPIASNLNTTTFENLEIATSAATVSGGGGSHTLADFDWMPVKYTVQGNFSGQPTPFNIEINSISMRLIPEPASFGLLAPGGLCAMRRRR